MRSCGAWRRLVGSGIVVVVLRVFPRRRLAVAPLSRRCRYVFVSRVFTRLERRVDRALKGIRRRAGGRPLQAVGASSQRGPRSWGGCRICRGGSHLPQAGGALKPRPADRKIRPTPKRSVWGGGAGLRRCGLRLVLVLESLGELLRVFYGVFHISGRRPARRSLGRRRRRGSGVSSALCLRRLFRWRAAAASFPFLAALTI